MIRCNVVGRRHNRSYIPAVMAAAALLTALASPAEARRRHVRPSGHSVVHQAGGGYSPPYADIVVDVKTGRTLHAVNEDELRHPASVTKVMTLYLLFEQIERGRFQLDSPLTISEYAASMAPSKLGLRPGSTISVEDAIKALVTKSANDVACAIGENIAGSESRFAEMMTRKALSLGMSRTHYANASGLPDPEQITTARDLAVLARAIQDRFPRQFRYFQTRSFAFRGRTIGNHNHLLGRVEGVDGIKTGYTRDSGFNLMTSAKIGERQIVAIVLGGKSGGSRDAIMASLVRTHLPQAFAGNRQAPMVAEGIERGRPAVVADTTGSRTRTRVASADEDTTVETTSSLLPSATATPGMKARPPAPIPNIVAAYTAPAAQPPFPVAGGKSAARLPSIDGASRNEPVARFAARAEPRVEAPAPTVGTPSAWVIQLGAMDDEDKAKAMLADARSKAGGALAKAAPYTVRVSHGGTTLYRARFSGFSEQSSAQDACSALKRSGFTCFATRS